MGLLLPTAIERTKGKKNIIEALSKEKKKRFEARHFFIGGTLERKKGEERRCWGREGGGREGEGRRARAN